MVTAVNFAMCILLQLRKKKGKLTGEGRTGEDSDRILEARNLISSWLVWESSITSQQWGKQSTSPFPPQNAAEAPEMLLLDGGVGFSAGDRAGADWEAADLPTAPLPCCWVPATPPHRTPENHFLENINQSALHVIQADKREDQKILSPGHTTNSPARGLTARLGFMGPFHLLKALNLLCEPQFFITHRQPLIPRCEKNASNIKEIYKKNETGKKPLGRHKLQRKESFKNVLLIYSVR